MFLPGATVFSPALVRYSLSGSPSAVPVPVSVPALSVRPDAVSAPAVPLSDGSVPPVPVSVAVSVPGANSLGTSETQPTSCIPHTVTSRIIATVRTISFFFIFSAPTTHPTPAAIHRTVSSTTNHVGDACVPPSSSSRERIP